VYDVKKRLLFSSCKYVQYSLGRLLWVDVIKLVSKSFRPSFCTYVFTDIVRTRKVFPISVKFGKYIEVDEWYMMACYKIVWPNPRSMSRSRSRRSESCKNGRLQSLSSRRHVMKRLMVNYNTPRQCLSFNWTGFWYSSSFSIPWPSDFGCSTYGKPLAGSWLTVQSGAYCFQL